MEVTTFGAVWGGCWAAAGEGFGVTYFWAGEVLALVSRPSIVKGTAGAGGVFLGASGRGVSESVAVRTLCVAARLCHLFDLVVF